MDASAVEDTASGRGRDLLMAKMSEIAQWVEGSAPGRDDEIAGVSRIETAAPDTAVFAMDHETLAASLKSQAGVVLANESLKDETVTDSRILWVKNARYAFSVTAKKLKISKLRGVIHPSAILGEHVEIGKETSVGPGVVIEKGVRIGEGCNVEARATIYSGTVLGDRVVVQAGAVLGATGFGYARDPKTGEYILFPQQGHLIVEDDVEIGANTTIDRGALGETRIGRGTKIDNLVHIGHNCLIGRNVIIAAQTGISGSSVVEDGAILGGQVGIGEHATVGEGVILGGGAGVLSGKKMRGPGQVFWGRPARPLKEYLRDLARLRKG